MKKIKEFLIPVIIVSISIILGIIFKDSLFGTLSLIFGFLNVYYMSIGKWYNYIFGILFSIVYAYICAINGLFGVVIFSVIFYTPLQISGLINWIRHREKDEVETRSLNFKLSMLLCTSIVVGSCILSLLLSLIPNQNLAFLDSTSQIVNLCGVVLGTLRYRESWYIWILNNVVDLNIWIINVVRRTPNAEMSLVTAAMYLVMNVIGIISWIKMERKKIITG